MAQNITLQGAQYADVPAVELPKTGGGTASFTDVSDTTAAASDVASGKYFYTSAGVKTAGTASGGGGAGVVVTDTTDVHGGTIREITAVDLSSDTVTAASMLSGATAHDHDGTAISGSIVTKTALDLTASGDTVTVPAGYYASAATKAVSAGSATTPATTVTANPSISVNSSGLITASVSTSKSITPTVSAGYVSSGTAGTVSVSGSNTSQLTTQAAQTIYPSTSDQTINSGRYLTGNQTIKGVAVSNTLSAENIKSGVVVTIGDSADADRIMSVTGTYSGGGGTSKNVQVAQSTSRSTSTSYTEVISLTCTKTGTYDVYWSTFRTSTSNTWGSQLYINDSAYGSAETASWSNHIQNIHLSNVQIDANEEVAVRVRSRGSNYYGYVGTLTIIEA